MGTKVYHASRNHSGVSEIELDSNLKFKNLPETLIRTTPNSVSYWPKSWVHPTYKSAYKAYVAMQLKAIAEATDALREIGAM